MIEAALKEIRTALGEIPILASEQRLLEKALAGESGTENGSGKGQDGKDGKDSIKSPVTSEKKKTLADGTYATESALSIKAATLSKMEALKQQSKPPLRGTFLSIGRTRGIAAPLCLVDFRPVSP